VTEDADLGVVIGRNGYKIAFLESITEEEAPMTVSAWIKQRTRWMKGFMLTFCGHFLDSWKLYKNLGFANLMIFFVFVCNCFYSFLSVPFLGMLTFSLFLRSDSEWRKYLFDG
jgi:cellulose synthase/poly-beta-1,6-N-acetylglucosamine synthase-like glycosyltransferase